MPGAAPNRQCAPLAIGHQGFCSPLAEAREAAPPGAHEQRGAVPGMPQIWRRIATRPPAQPACRIECPDHSSVDGKWKVGNSQCTLNFRLNAVNHSKHSRGWAAINLRLELLARARELLPQSSDVVKLQRDAPFRSNAPEGCEGCSCRSRYDRYASQSPLALSTLTRADHPTPRSGTAASAVV